MLVKRSNKEQAGNKLKKTTVLGQLKVNCQCPTFLMEIRGVVCGVSIEMTEDERKQGIGDEKGFMLSS